MIVTTTCKLQVFEKSGIDYRTHPSDFVSHLISTTTLLIFHVRNKRRLVPSIDHLDPRAVSAFLHLASRNRVLIVLNAGVVFEVPHMYLKLHTSPHSVFLWSPPHFEPAIWHWNVVSAANRSRKASICV